MRSRSISLNPIPEERPISFASRGRSASLEPTPRHYALFQSPAWNVPILEEDLEEGPTDWPLIGFATMLIGSLIMALAVSVWIAIMTIPLAVLMVVYSLQSQPIPEPEPEPVGSFIVITVNDDHSAQI